VLAGISLALAQTPMNAAAMSAVGAERRTNVSGLLATARQSSALFGLAILGAAFLIYVVLVRRGGADHR
jgi:hypothetical protein